MAGGNSSTADQVLIYNGTGYSIYFYQIDARIGNGWRNVNDLFTDVGATNADSRGFFDHFETQVSDRFQLGDSCSTRPRSSLPPLPSHETLESARRGRTLLFALLTNSRGATIAWAAAIDNGLVLQDTTTMLPTGDLIRIGVFSISDASIQSLLAAGNFSAVNAAFRTLGSVAAGAGVRRQSGIFFLVFEYARADRLESR